MLLITCVLFHLAILIAILSISLIFCKSRVIPKAKEYHCGNRLRRHKTNQDPKKKPKKKSAEPKENENVVNQAALFAREGGVEETIRSILEPWTLTNIKGPHEKAGSGTAELGDELTPEMVDLVDENRAVDFEFMESLEQTNRVPTKKVLEDDRKEENAGTSIEEASDESSKKKFWMKLLFFKKKKDDKSKEKDDTEKKQKKTRTDTEDESFVSEENQIEVVPSDQPSTSEASRVSYNPSYMAKKPRKISSGGSASGSASKSKGSSKKKNTDRTTVHGTSNKSRASSKKQESSKKKKKTEESEKSESGPTQVVVVEPAASECSQISMPSYLVKKDKKKKNVPSSSKAQNSSVSKKKKARKASSKGKK